MSCGSKFPRDWFSRLKNHESSGLRIVIVDVNEEPEKVRAYMAENGVYTLVALDRRSPRVAGSAPVADALYGGGYIPHFILLAPDRTVLFTKAGFQEEPLFTAIEKALGAKGARGPF